MANTTAASEAAPLIEVNGLQKSYGGEDVLVSLSLTVRPGEVFGVLGPNGSGKSTLAHILVGLSRPTGGTALVLGATPGELRARRGLGYLAQRPAYHGWLTVRETLRLHARLMRLPRSEREAAVDAALRTAVLTERADDRVDAVAPAIERRLGIALAFLGDPAVVILDEPTESLDSMAHDDLHAAIRAARGRGAAVLLISHILAEVDHICDRVAVVDHGRVVASGKLDDVLGVSETRIRVSGLQQQDLPAIASFGPPVLEGDRLVIRPMDESRVPALVALLVGMGTRVHDVRSGRSSMEERFTSLVARDRRVDRTL